MDGEQVTSGELASVARAAADDREMILGALARLEAEVKDGTRERTEARNERLAAFNRLSGELAVVSERLDDFEQARQGWQAALSGVGLVGPEEFSIEHFEAVVRDALAPVSGDDVAEVFTAMAVSAAQDREGLRRRIEEIEAENAELLRRLSVLASGTSALLGLLRDSVVDAPNRFASDVVEPGVECQCGDHVGQRTERHVPEVR